MTYYKVFLEVEPRKKPELKYNRTIYVQTNATNPIETVFNIVHRIKFSKLISAAKIDRSEYIGGVSATK